MGYTHGRKWDECSIIEEIMKIVNDFNMNTFPTHREMNLYFNNNSLSVAVSKHGGTEYFSQKLNLKIKRCESAFGEKYELFAIKHIKEKTNLDSEKMKLRYPYDVLTNKNIKIDIKVSKRFKANNGYYYTFNLEKINPTCDIFIAYCIDEEDNIDRVVIIPSCVTRGLTQLSFGKNKSKYDKYIDNWDVIKKYDDFYNNIIKHYDY